MIKTIPKYMRFARILDILDFHVLLPFITESHLDFRGCLSMNLLQAKTTDWHMLDRTHINRKENCPP